MVALLDAIPIGAAQAWLVAALPLAAFVILAVGRVLTLPKVAAVISVGAIGLAFFGSLGVLGDLLSNGEYMGRIVWLSVNSVEFGLSYIVDPISVMMIILVTSVSLGVQVYSMEYMRGEARFGWYFAAHSLFAASMLALVLTGSLLLLYISWELVGLCSFLLIGFYWERRSAAEAAKKAFITTRFGDVGLLIGVILAFVYTGTFDIREVIASLSGSEAAIVAFLLFLGAMGKSAQFPFHIWLPDAMEGPTPVSALIHAATMVAAGVFLVARMFDLFVEAPGVLWFVAIIGLTTAILGGVLALGEVDFKRILAYSTVSQLGLMMLALGAAGLAHDEVYREPSGGLFHLLSHGYFKALLFLTAGVALHAIHASAASIGEVRGLFKAAPLTAIVLIIGSLSLVGGPPLSGFFSKEGILAPPLEIESLAGYLLFFGAIAASFLSALYMTRMVLVVVQGEPRTPAPDSEHRAMPGVVGPKLQDPPLLMAVPLVILAALAAVLGIFFTFGWDIIQFLTDGERAFHLDTLLALASTLTAVAGIGIGLNYWNGRERLDASMLASLGPFPRVVANRFYIDMAAQWLIDRVALAFAGLIREADRRIINDVGVDGSAARALDVGRLLRVLQTGYVFNYALVFTIAAVVIVAVASLSERG